MIVAGIGTDVGKTVVSGVLALALEIAYWKPISAGSDDCEWISALGVQVHGSAVSLQTPCAPHIAARIEKRKMEFHKPYGPLIIEMAGGLLVPVDETRLAVDLFAEWDSLWVLVVRPYLGAINHTLLSVEALRSRGVEPLGLIFSGAPVTSICHHARLPCLGVVAEHRTLTPNIIRRHAEQWKTRPPWKQLRNSSPATKPTVGIPTTI